jgi:hypothetical protein
MDRNLQNMVVYLQRGKYLCWAANIQSLFNYLFDLKLSQCDVLSYVFNATCCSTRGVFLGYDKPYNLDNALTATNDGVGSTLSWEFVNEQLNVDAIKSQFNKQLPVILSMRTRGAESGHYIMLLGCDENDQFIVGDPYQSETASYFHCTPDELNDNYRGLQWSGTYIFSI